MNIFESEAKHFEASMRDIALKYSDDNEVCHILMDELMLEILEKFGFQEGVKIFRETSKWYA